MRFDPAALPAALANRVLGREAWARACLAAHAGRVFAVAVGPLVTPMRIDESGAIAPRRTADGPPDLKLTLSPLAVPSLLADPTRWDEFVAVDGDPALAATLKGLAETLPWFVERALAGALGPIVGQRVADAGRRLLALPGYAGARVGASIASYARDEATLCRDGRGGAFDRRTRSRRPRPGSMRFRRASTRWPRASRPHAASGRRRPDAAGA